MAVFPCEHTPHRYQGPQRSLYITRYAGSVVQTRKLRLCDRHFDELVLLASRDLEHADENSLISLVCASCGQPKDEGMSCRFYDGQGEPAVWAGEFCAADAERVGEQLLWSKGRPV